MSGIEDLRRRRQLAASVPRRMPAPLRPRTESAAEAEDKGLSDQEDPVEVSGRPLDADPMVALGVRIPRSLDDRLAVLGVQLRGRGLRVTKAELVAHALRQLPESVTDELMAEIQL